MSAILPGEGLGAPAGPMTHRVIPVYGHGIVSAGLAAFGGEASAIHLAGSMGAGPIRVEDAAGNVTRWIGRPRTERFVRVRPVRPGEV